MALSFEHLLKDKLHINYDQSVHFGKNSNIHSAFEYPNERLQERYIKMIDHLYDLFKSRVSVGRDLSMERVQELAQGKVENSSLICMLQCHL